MSTSLIGRLGSSTFRLSTAWLFGTGRAFHAQNSVEVARGLLLLFGIGTRPFQYGVRGQGGTIFTAALPSDWWQVQADMRTHLIHRPARDIFPPLGGARVFSC